jgi:hypothetical protein
MVLGVFYCTCLTTDCTDSHGFCLATEVAENTEGLHRRRLKNALWVIAESVLDTSICGQLFSSDPGWVLPASSEVKRTRHRRINWWYILDIRQKW